MAFYIDNGFAAADAEVAHVLQAAATTMSTLVRCAREDRLRLRPRDEVARADEGDSLRHYLKSLGYTTLHPLLTGWLEKLEPYRIDPQGFQGYSGELDRPKC